MDYNSYDNNINLINIITKDYCKLRTSSILDNNGKLFGKDFMMDSNPDTCWCSGQGKSQSIIIELRNPVILNIKSIEITGQGGFIPKSIDISYYKEDININKKADKIELTSISLIDNSENQKFSINHNPIKDKVYALILNMNKFTDFFGRVSLYSLKIFCELS